MKFKVNENCIGCGLCAEICPQVFSMTDEGVAEARSTDVEEELLPDAETAMHSCPTEAIEGE